MFTETTNSIRITVNPKFSNENSETSLHEYVWEYNILIENYSSTTVQLVERFWEIIDGSGKKISVTGQGVVGSMPIMAPKQKFEYSSFTKLSTKTGFMKGKYLMLSEGKLFSANIPLFSLDTPEAVLYI